MNNKAGEFLDRWCLDHIPTAVRHWNWRKKPAALAKQCFKDAALMNIAAQDVWQVSGGDLAGCMLKAIENYHAWEWTNVRTYRAGITWPRLTAHDLLHD